MAGERWERGRGRRMKKLEKQRVRKKQEGKAAVLTFCVGVRTRAASGPGPLPNQESLK